jgi:hypothetical protein
MPPAGDHDEQPTIKLIHAAAFNVGLLMRVKYGLRKPRSLGAAACALVLRLMQRLATARALLRSIDLIESLRGLIHKRRSMLSLA